MPTSTVRTNFCLVLLSHSWSGKDKIVYKLRNKTMAECKAELKRLRGYDFAGAGADYQIVGPKQLKQLLDTQKTKQAARIVAGHAKAQATRKKRGTKPEFILCPHCKSRSKIIYSEFGGLQTRQCKQGHRFEHDKWLADRMFWAFVR